jgi:hypothetical protein
MLSRRRFVTQGASVAMTATLGARSTRPTAATSAATPEASPVVTAPNVQATTDPAYPDHAEPSLAVNPRDPSNLLGATQYFKDARSRPVVGTFLSFDGGATWQDNGPLVLPPGTDLALDVTAGFAADGTGFVAAATGSQATGEGGVAVWRTDDGGRTFAAPVVVARAGGDHPWLAIGAETGHLYLAWSGEGHRSLMFGRSTDGGRSFETPRAIAGIDPGAVVVAAGPDGAVHILSGEYPAMAVVSSSDDGVGFGAPRPVPPLPAEQATTADQTIRTLTAAATDPRDGTLYVATAVLDPATQRNVVLVWRSPNGDRPWEEPVAVPFWSPGDEAGAYEPQLAVAPNRTVCVSAYVMADDIVDVALAWSDDQGASFRSGPRVTTADFNPVTDLGPESKGHFKNSGDFPWIGDYQGLAVGPSSVYPCWTDTRTGQMQIFVAAVPTGS